MEEKLGSGSNLPLFKKILLSEATAFIVFFILMLILFSKVPIFTGDDEIFAAISLKYNFLEFISERYWYWSGRLFSEALVYLFTSRLFFLYQWLCAALITVCSFSVYKWITAAKEMRPSHKLTFAYISCFGFALISSSILSSSVFWVSGSLNYFVPFTFGIIAFTPFVFALKNIDYKPGIFLKTGFIASAVFAAFSQEQVSLCLFAFSAFSIAYLLVKRRKLSRFLISLLIITTVCMIVSLSAPGNSIRYEASVVQYFPQFEQIGFSARMAVSAHFCTNMLINQSCLPLMFLWFIIGSLLFTRKKSVLSKVISIALITVAIIMLLRFISPADFVFSRFTGLLSPLFTFNYLTWQSIRIPSVFFPYLFWGIALLLIPAGIILIWGKSKETFFYGLLYLGAIATFALISFSPSLYVSGGRTGYIGNMLLILLLYFLLTHYNKFPRIAAILICISVLKLILLFTLWHTSGFELWYGVMDTQNIPFIVMGP